MAKIKKLAALAGAAAAARKYAAKHPDKVDRMATKAGRIIDQRTKGKYHDKIDGALTKLRSSLPKQA
ncbi:antitoxin [Actinokineospora sp. HUAS TT18]|uniref:antitoxin n=1 Tax=Actinokineospora sp. HUAS TT18 TaxID=3447451 RepID=UPI003F5272B7